MHNGSRRGFLGSLAAIVAGSAITVTAAPERKDIIWSGWREAPTQFVRFGFWVAHDPAHKDDFGREYLYSTTMGVVSRAHEGDCLYLARINGWPWLTPFNFDEHGEALKERARLALLERLDVA